MMGGSPESTAGRGAARSPSPRSAAQDAGTGSALDGEVPQVGADGGAEGGAVARVVRGERRGAPWDRARGQCGTPSGRRLR